MTKRRIGFKVADRALSDDDTARLVASYRKTGVALSHRRIGKKVVAWVPRQGFVYSQVRAISARVNQNYDAWPSEELKKSYRTFVGKPVFVNHTNEDWKTARGVVVAARYVEKGADKYVECIMETDAKRFPKLGHEIRTGGIDSVSMGVEAGFTICSVCDNKATDFHDMCKHIKFHKGEHFRSKKTGKKVMAYENCYKLGFFELSYVFDPADETAVVSRVIAANKESATDFNPIGWDRYQPTHRETELVWHPKSEAYQDHLPPNLTQRGKDPSMTQVFDNLSSEEQDQIDPLKFMRPYSPSKQEYHVRERDKPHSRTSKDERKREFMSYWYRTAFGETKAPEDIDTLRDESEDDTDLFHHWVESPPELQGPDMKRTEQEDLQQEQQGLDQDRNAEDVEEFAGQGPGQNDAQFIDDEPQEPVMPINPPEKKVGGHNRGARMSRYFYAEDDDTDQSDDDVDALLDEAEDDIDAYESGGDDDSGDDYDDDDGDDDTPDEDDASDEDDDDDDGDSQPPWLEKDSYYRRPAKRRASRRNKRGGAMSRTTLASRNPRGRHFQADESGHTDGGPYGVDDSQGNQEEVFISQVPGAEAVAAPCADDAQISNSPGNLVAYKRPKFDPNHYQRLADVVRALPPEQRAGMARRMVAMLVADNQSFNGRTFYEAANVPVVKRGNRYFYAEDLEDADKVDPSLSGTDVQDLKGDDFDSLALDDVETQPKDASIHAFRVFDQWLANVSGKTAAQHRNANFIRRAAASYVQRTGADLRSLFPTLEYVLAEARKFEGANMRKRAEDMSLDVAAPQDRIDVEAPVKNVTDADAQASQFDLGDFAHNAGDQLADPVLDVVDGNAGTWAPDKEASVKLATAAEAVRLADAYIAAYPNKYSAKNRWELTGRFETLRQAVVRDRIRVLEAVIEDQSKTARKVTAARSRGTKGIPVGFGSTRTAATRRFSAIDPDTDSAIFF